jgi:hypothetical protein
LNEIARSTLGLASTGGLECRLDGSEEEVEPRDKSAVDECASLGEVAKAIGVNGAMRMLCFLRPDRGK